MRCVIFSGGDLKDPEWHRKQLEESDFIICADRGAEYAWNLGLVPRLVIGDLDSLKVELQEKLEQVETRVLVFPAEKDETDTELALREALKLQPDEVVIFAALGDRIDHSLANIYLLAGYLHSGITIRLADPFQTMTVTSTSTVISGFAGQTVSLLALSPEVRGLNLEGFYYPLEMGTLKMGSTLGISNLLFKERAEIKLVEGLLLVIQNNF